MKIWLALLLSASITAALCAQGSSASGGKRNSAPPAKAATPGKAGPAGAEKEEAPPKIEGMEISRGDKGYLGVQIVDGRFKINFYDAEKKPMQPDVVRAALRWDPRYKVGMERVVLNPGPENTLTSERFIRPPYNFKLFIVLVNDTSAGEDPVGETYTIDFRQEA